MAGMGKILDSLPPEQIEKAVAANRQTVKPIPLWTRRIAAAAASYESEE